MEYERLWQLGTRDDFGERVADASTSEYVARVGTRPDEIVVVDPGNGFNYVFDLAGTLSGSPYSREARVVGAWGRPQPGGVARDRAHMRGHPRPRRDQDDRGHLIACAAGGGYDINLVAMDALFNRGQSAEGARFRAMERQAASVPGSLFFVRPVYDDATARPSRFEVGVQVGDALRVDVFVNSPVSTRTMPLAVLRRATAFPIDAELVNGCLDRTASGDALFARGWRAGISSLTRSERNAVAGVTGHVGELVAELLLGALEWRVLWHFEGPGRHGVDLVFLTPDDKVFVAEVKSTLVGGSLPRLSARDLAQMSAAWIDKADNPGMAELGP